MGNPPSDVSGIKLKVSVANALVSVEDNFTLQFMDEGEFLAQEGEGARQKLIQLGLDKKEANNLTIENDIEVNEEGEEFRIKTKTDNQLNYAIKLLKG